MKPANLENESITSLLEGDGDDYENNGRMFPPYYQLEPNGV